MGPNSRRSDAMAVPHCSTVDGGIRVALKCVIALVSITPAAIALLNFISYSA